MLGTPGAAGKRCPAPDIAFQSGTRFGRGELKSMLPGLGCSCSEMPANTGAGGTDSSVGVRIPAKALESPGDVGAIPSCLGILHGNLSCHASVPLDL